MCEKASIVDPAEWVIECFVAGIGWSLSRMNEGPEAHSLQCALEQWNAFKRGDFEDSPLDPSGLLTEPDRYRLRNVVTEDIIMGAIL
jgi:hypothetical protein